jgi:hypothetical protein
MDRNRVDPQHVFSDSGSGRERLGHNDSLVSPVRYSFAVPPSAVTVTVSSATAAHVMWAANGNPGSTRYRLETSADGRTFSLVMIGTTTETVAEELIDGATNYFRVRAENGDGVTTVYSSTASVFLPFAIPPTRPGAPFVTHQKFIHPYLGMG